MIDPALYARLQKLCLRSFPDRLAQRISQVRVLDDERRPAWSFTLSWRQGRQPRVERLRLYRHADRWTWWNGHDLDKPQREWTVMRWLYGEGLPVPRLYTISDGQDGRALLAAHVSDRPADALWDGKADARAEAERAARVEQLAALLASLHRLQPPLAVREVLPQVTVAEQMVRLMGIGRRCQDEGIVEAVRELALEKVEERPPCVVHGDPRFGSVRHDARGITAMLNWESSVQGDPRWDVARVVVWLRYHHTPDLADRFCQVYGERSDAPLAGIAYWETAAAVQQWAVGLSTLAEQSALQEQVALWGEHAWRGLTRWRATRSP